MSEVGMIDYKLNLVAGVVRRLDTEGSYFQVIKSAVPLMLRFNGNSGWITREAPHGAPVPPFRFCEVMTEADAEVNLALGLIPNGSPYDGAGIFNGTVNVAVLTAANSMAAGADVVVPAGNRVLLVPANPQRVELSLDIGPDQSSYVRIGGALVDDTGGRRLYPGVVAYLAGQQEFWLYNPGAAPVTVAYLELLKV